MKANMRADGGLPRVSAAFFATGALFLGAGMIWGMAMGAAQDFALAPAHAHLNLLGWVTGALYGAFYALTGQTMSPRLAWTNYALSTAGVIVMIPSLAMLLAGRGTMWELGVAIGAASSFLGLVAFGISVAREMFAA